MKNFLLIIFLLISFTGFTQPPHGRGGGDFSRIQGLKVAYLTNRLNLTSDEAAKFWPVYNKYTAEIMDIRKQHSTDVIAEDEKALAVKKKYFVEFKKMLGSDERANQVFYSEKEFGNYIRKEIESRQKMKPPFNSQQNNNTPQ